MEHLTRNTNNDRLIYTIESTRREDQNIIDKNLKELIDKVVNILTGILSSIVSASLISIWKNEQKIPLSYVVITISFIIITLGLWFVLGKWLLPRFYDIFFKSHINIDPEDETVSVRRFNTEVMQKVAEIAEIIVVIKTTNEVQCKTLNFVISLYKFQEIVDFMYTIFVSEKKTIRKFNNQGSAETLRYSFNIYTVEAVLKVVKNIQDAMEDLIENDNAIKGLEGLDLLKNDLSCIGNKLKKIDIYSYSN